MNAVGMDVAISEHTEQMAALSLQGPKSRAILTACAPRRWTASGSSAWRRTRSRASR